MTLLSFFSAAPPAPYFLAVSQPALISSLVATFYLSYFSSLCIVQDIYISDSPYIRSDVLFFLQTYYHYQSIALMPRCCFFAIRTKFTRPISTSTPLLMFPRRSLSACLYTLISFSA